MLFLQWPWSCNVNQLTVSIAHFPECQEIKYCPGFSKGQNKIHDGVSYGRGLGSQCYLTCLHASCNVATFNVWLFNAWYSCFNSNLTLLHSISSFCNLASVHLTFVLCPCRIFIVQCVMPFFVLPLFILRPAIILTSSCHHCFVYANCNYTPRWRFTRTNELGGH